MDIERIIHNEIELSVIIRRSFKSDGIEFFTPSDYSQQLGYMRRPKGYIIDPHVHNRVIREVNYTNEVLIIRSGKVKVDFYDDDKNYLCSKVLLEGDVILLIRGGHGFEMLQASEMIEVKQGPYAGDSDKTRFKPS